MKTTLFVAAVCVALGGLVIAGVGALIAVGAYIRRGLHRR